MSNVILYRNYSDKKEVHKNLEILTYGINNKIVCQIVEPCSIVSPTIKLGSANFDFSRTNYFYLSDFKRFYFIESVELLNNGMVQISGSIDPLYTYKDWIENLYCTVKRQEFYYNPKIIDNEIIARVDRQINKQNIGTVGGQATGAHIALTVTGGL